MPTSTYEHIPLLVSFLIALRPQSILDVGVGNGKMGFVARDLLDVMLGERFKREAWQIQIDGIEIFADYIQEHHHLLYNRILIGDAFTLIDTMGDYDVVILGDVLEHFEKDRALCFLDKCARHCEHIILSIPLGEQWTQPMIYGNPYEEHRSFWTKEEIEPFSTDHGIFVFQNIGEYGCFLIKADDLRHYRIMDEADTLFGEGKRAKAIDGMRSALETLPPHIASEYMLVDLLLKNHQVEEAIGRLRRVLKMFPDEQAAREYIEALSRGVKKRSEHPWDGGLSDKPGRSREQAHLGQSG